jgi:hypothetical protein
LLTIILNITNASVARIPGPTCRAKPSAYLPQPLVLQRISQGKRFYLPSYKNNC